MYVISGFHVGFEVMGCFQRCIKLDTFLEVVVNEKFRWRGGGSIHVA